MARAVLYQVENLVEQFSVGSHPRILHEQTLLCLERSTSSLREVRSLAIMRT